MALFKMSKAIELAYMRQYSTIIDRINEIVETYYDPDNPLSIGRLVKALEAYSKQLQPWAKQIAKTYVNQVSVANLRDWMSLSTQIGKELKKSYQSGDPIFKLATQLQNEQVDLIVTIPKRMAERAQHFSRQWSQEGLRPAGLAAKIQSTNQVAEYVATRIARTEISKANATLTRARALSVGITHYEWVTAGDSIVRSSHRHMNGKICSYDDPPFVSAKEGHHHPGEIYNCRCYARPIIPSNRK